MVLHLGRMQVFSEVLDQGIQKGEVSLTSCLTGLESAV